MHVKKTKKKNKNKKLGQNLNTNNDLTCFMEGTLVLKKWCNTMFKLRTLNFYHFWLKTMR